MKTRNCILYSLCALAALSCEPKHQNDNLYDPAVYIVNNGLQTTDLFYDVEGGDTYTVHVWCGGFDPIADAVVNISVDESAVDAYNAENGTALKVLPVDCYTLESGDKALSDKRASYEITFHSAALKALSTTEDYSDLRTYVVPVRLKGVSEGLGEPKTDAITTALVAPNMSKMGFVFSEAGTESLTLSDVDQTDTEFIVRYRAYTPVQNNWNNAMKFEFNVDVPGMTYGKLPSDSFTVETSSEAGFTAGLSEVDWTVHIAKAKVTDLFYSLTARVSSGGDFIVMGDSVSVRNFVCCDAYDCNKVSWVDANSYTANGPAYAVDGKPGTMWEAAYNSTHFGVRVMPYWASYKLEDEVTIVGFELLRRNHTTYAKDLRSGYYEVSADGENWVQVGDFDFGTTSTAVGPFYHSVTPTKASYFKFWMTASNRNQVGSVAEITVLYR